MKYQEVLDYVASLSSYGIVPGLENIERLCDLLGNPQNELKFVHIAGTNGKGSALAYISTILKCAGYRVGRYLSPVISDYREKIQVNEKVITQKALCQGMELVKAACEQMVEKGYPHPTPFEVETALAFWYFREKKCDIVVLECGMGGRGDATNLIQTTCVSVIASVSMDHMNFLGKTLADIAFQKAGIMKEGRPVVMLCQSEGAQQVFEEEAAQKGCALLVADPAKASGVRYGVERQRFHYDGYKDLEIRLAGKHQVANAVLAIEVIKVLSKEGFPITEAQLRKGLSETHWSGRFTVIGKKPYFIVDGAHNEDAAKKLAESIDFYFTNKRIIYIMGVLRDKEYEKIIELTYPYADHIITVTPPDNSRAMQAYDLAMAVNEVCQRSAWQGGKDTAGQYPQVTAVDSLEEAVEISHLLAGKDDVILAFGSLSYLGRLMEIVKKRSETGKSGKGHCEAAVQTQAPERKKHGRS